MDVLDLFLKKYSYKFPKGYPDLKNEQDIILLENILFNIMGVETSLNEKYNPLTYGDITKPGREIRAFKIAQKIEKGEPFELVGDQSKILFFNKDEYKNLFLNQDLDKIKLIAGSKINTFPFFKDEEGNTYGIKDISKTLEFGGKGVGSGTKVEDENLIIAGGKLKKAIEENNNEPITVVVGNIEYPNIYSIKTQKVFPKSDFNLYDINDKPQIFISHKKGGKNPSAKDFIRWSGFTEFGEYDEVKNFNKALKNFLKENNLDRIPNNSSFISKIKNKDLINKIVYGKNFSNEFGPDNVQIIIQGEISFNKISDGIYKLTGSEVLLNGELPQGLYTPYLMSKYRSDRNMFGIPSNEAIATTEAIAKSASNIYELTDGKFIKIK